MPREQLSQKIGYKLHIYGHGETIDVVIEDIEKKKDGLYVKMDVSGDYSVNAILSPSHGPVVLNDGLVFNMELLNSGQEPQYSLYIDFAPGYVTKRNS